MPGDLWSALRHTAALRPRVPVATYRLQLNRHLTFADAERLIPYLDGLGISDLYTSSYLTARPGSLHGYDITDHNRLNPEIGTEADFDRLADALRARGMGQILDVVPNHMGIAGGCNPRWNDLLENGPSSPSAEFFDVDWDPVKRQLANRVLLPILGDQYGRVLENRELRLAYDQGAFGVWYHETRLPVAPRSVTRILTHALPGLLALFGDADPQLQEFQSILRALANLPGRTEADRERIRERARETEVIRRRLARLTEESPAIRTALEETLRAYNGRGGDPRSFDLLDRLLEDQVYRLASWQVAAEEINYRRFFDVNELAAIRMENPAIFRETHRLIFRLIAESRITGLRLDHPDGLADPAGYFRALQRERAAHLLRAEAARDGSAGGPGAEAAVARALADFDRACLEDPAQPDCRPLYLLAEKVLAQGERLPGGWAVHGTTGYEYLALADGLFVDTRAERAMTAAHAAFTGVRTPYADLVYESKRLILRVSMSSELNVLGHDLERLAERNRYSRDFTLNSLREALREVIACFPVYRTYICGRESGVALQDRACVEVAIAFARRRNPTTNASVFDFVRDTLLLRYPADADEAYRDAQRAFLRKFQQVTAPVTAKGVEDTAFYRDSRLVSLNEVGGGPDRFGIGVDEFHAQCRARLASRPAGLNASSTHDTKRSEDVRARIHVLSEMPREWRAAVSRWRRMNQRHLTPVDGRPAPDRSDEYLLYQTLVGAWPLAPAWPAEAAAFVVRIQGYLLKAAKEAKRNTSWINPNAAYDEAIRQFVERILQPRRDNRFPPDLAAFQAPVARLGMVNSLALTLLKVAAPGVPDVYQGTELWDFSLVDPDNRRPVDFALRQRHLDDLRERIASGDLAGLSRELLAYWEDGRLKLYVLHRALAFRRRADVLFSEGAYLPLSACGEAAANLCAFARHRASAAVVALVPRLVAARTGGGARLPVGRTAWGDTLLCLPPELPDGPYIDLFTGARHQTARTEKGNALSVAQALEEFPVALLAGC